MSPLDIAAGALAAIAGWIGFRQGLSVIVLRCAVAAAGCAGFKFLQPPVAQWIAPHAGSWTAFASVTLVILGVLMIQEILAWVWRKMRDALLLGLPDRLAGLMLGLVAGAALAGVGGTILKNSHNFFETAWSQSHMRPVLERLEPWIKGHLTPETLTRGKERLKNMVKPPQKP